MGHDSQGSRQRYWGLFATFLYSLPGYVEVFLATAFCEVVTPWLASTWGFTLDELEGLTIGVVGSAPALVWPGRPTFEGSV